MNIYGGSQSVSFYTNYKTILMEKHMMMGQELEPVGTSNGFGGRMKKKGGKASTCWY